MVNNTFAEFIRFISSGAPPISRLRSSDKKVRPLIVNGDETNGDLKVSIGKALATKKLDMQLDANAALASQATDRSSQQMITNILAVRGDTDIYSLLLSSSSTSEDYVTTPLLKEAELPISAFHFRGSVDDTPDATLLAKFLFGSVYNALPPYEEPSFGMSVLACPSNDRQAYYQYRSAVNPHLRLLATGGLFVLRTFSDNMDPAVRELLVEFDLYAQSRLGQRLVALFSEWAKLRIGNSPGSNTDNPFVNANYGPQSSIVNGISSMHKELTNFIPGTPYLYTQDIVDGVAVATAITLYQSAMQICFDNGTIPSFGENARLITLCCGLALAQGIVASEQRGVKGSLLMLVDQVVQTSAVWLESAKAVVFDENRFTSFFFRDNNPTNDIFITVRELFESHYNIKKSSFSRLSITGASRAIRGIKDYVADVSPDTKEEGNSSGALGTVTKGIRVVQTIARVAKYLL